MDGKRALLTLLVAAIVACGGTTPASNSGASSSAAATPAGGTAGTGTTSGSVGSGTPSATGPRLSDALTAARLTQYKITYKYTIGAAGGAVAGQQSGYFKPPKQRYDFSTSEGGQTTTISFYTLPDGTFYCMTFGTTKQCFKAQGVGSPIDSNPAALFQQSMIGNPSAYGGTFVESRTIAGQASSCYDVNAAAGAAAGFTTGRWCFTRDGIMTLSSFGAAGSTISLEATNVSTTVPDSDFDLPAKPSN